MTDFGYWLSSEEHTPLDLVRNAARAEELFTRVRAATVTEPRKVLENFRSRYAREGYPDLENYKLATLANFFGVELKESHRALPDAEATANLLIWFGNDLPKRIAALREKTKGVVLPASSVVRSAIKAGWLAVMGAALAGDRRWIGT